jgi:hypothetical protein
MIDLAAYFRREAAIYALPGLMARQRERDAAVRSARTAKGNRTRREQRA